MCWIATFGRDISNHGGLLQFEDFSTAVLTLNFDLDVSKVTVTVS